MIQIERYHDICFGHRVYGHENKCAHLHGHNYRFTVYVRSFRIEEKDSIGRIIDFSLIKEKLFVWLEKMWDHKMMIWEEDPIISYLKNIEEEIVETPFNPTAENIADYFLREIAPQIFYNSDVYLYSVKVEETRKCSATATLEEKEVLELFTNPGYIKPMRPLNNDDDLPF